MRRLPLAAFALAAILAPPAMTQTAAPRLAFPLTCEIGRTCEVQHHVDRGPGPATRDYRCGLKTYDGHTGTDIRLLDMPAMRRGVTVLAAAPGKVLKTRDGVPDHAIGDPVDPKDPQGLGNAVIVDIGGGWQVTYAHLARGSVTVKPGDAVARGQAVGRVGLSGLTEFPHLHIEVRRNGKVVDPFAPDMAAAGCGAQAGLWTPEALAAMPYRAGAVLNVGFTEVQPNLPNVENGAVRPAGPASPWLIAYVRSIALLPGDVTELILKDPKGAVLSEGRGDPLVRWRAQDLRFVGKRRPAGGWPPGVYSAEFRVLRGGKTAVSRRFEIRL